MANVAEAVAPRSPWSIKRTEEDEQEEENFKPKSKLELVK